VQNYKKTLT